MTAAVSHATGRSDRRALHDLGDSRLAQRHMEGDAQAFGALVDRYQTRLLNFVNRTIGDRERAEALVQEVFIRAFRHLRRFDRTKKFSTWIYTIASSLAKTELLQRPLVREDATAHLPESLRDAFVLRELEGMSYEDIAEITGCNVETVKSRLSRARSRVALRIEPLEPARRARSSRR